MGKAKRARSKVIEDKNAADSKNRKKEVGQRVTEVSGRCASRSWHLWISAESDKKSDLQRPIAVIGARQPECYIPYMFATADGYAQAQNFYSFGGVRWYGGGTQHLRYASMQERDVETQGWQDPTTNRITSSGFGYDAAGNMTSDGTNSYTWDAEGRLKSVSNAISGTTNYTYDGDGKRVVKSSGTLYWYAPGGSILTETDASGNLLKDYTYFAGSRMAMVMNHYPYFYYGDQLGSSRVMTNLTGTVCYDADFYPFGGERNFVNTCGQNYKFTGMERDAETGNDHTWFRNYASNLGRWVSPDPRAGSIFNPQSLNRYAYVLNNPTTLNDPLGSCANLPQGWAWGDAVNCKSPHRLPCYTKDCADQYYGGYLFPDMGSLAGNYAPICVVSGVAGYCGMSALQGFVSPTGSDEFDVLDPKSGVYWTAPPGSTVIDSSGRVSTSTGSLGFSDLLWSEASTSSNVMELPAAADQRLRDAVLTGIQYAIMGNYLFLPNPGVATAQSPVPTAFAPNPGTLWTPLPSFTGQ